jgi:lipoprotein-releasing system permease protein
VRGLKPYGWIVFVAGRYVSRGRRNRSSSSSILAILGIFTGVLALIVIISVMNGFQLGFIESIVEVSSYHIRVESLPVGTDTYALASGIRSLPLVRAAYPFLDLQGIVRGNREEQQVAAVRGLPPDALESDRGMAEKLEFEYGEFDIREDNTIILGAELARRLGVHYGDEISLLSLSGAGLFGGTPSDDPAFPETSAHDSRFRITGIFRTGFWEYDLSWAFINLETAEQLTGEEGSLSLGIKLQSRWQDSRGMELIRKNPEIAAILKNLSVEVRPWRDYNRAFYGALRTEKLLMFFLVGLIFIVVGLNIFQAQRRAVLERREEIGLLRAVGASEQAVRLIFVWDGVIIGGIGAGLGLLLGLLIARHISACFTILETLVNGV